MKIGLGTAQFGLDYGVSNKKGKIQISEATKILEIALRNQITVLDTAFYYGDSEQTIGDLLTNNNAFSIVTKTAKFNKEQLANKDVEILLQSFSISLERLKQHSIYCLMFHDANDLLCEGSDLLFTAVSDLKKKGLIRKIGVSIYEASQIDLILKKYPIDLIQFPFNVFDQRLLKSGHLSQLKNLGIETHVRSVFLQGLLLMHPKEVAQKNPLAMHRLEEFYADCTKNGYTQLQAALSFIASQRYIDYAIVGVTSGNELNEILKVLNGDMCTLEWDKYFIEDVNIIDPRKW